jgi:catechol 2,3-dioxygenase-like lactoylglutathione lyase family enzyme
MPRNQDKENLPMTTKPRFGFALEYVSDIEAAKRFYVDVLGLDVEREHPVFVQFKDQAGTSFAIASDESLSGSGEELYWLVDDAEAAFSELSRKAEVSLPLKQMPFGIVFGIKDPAGRLQYLLELAQDRPSRRVQ